MPRDTSSRSASVFRVVALICLAACGGGDDDDDDGPGGGPDARPAVDGGSDDRAIDFPVNRRGWIYLVEGYAGVDGVSAAVRDRVDVPPATMVAAEGDCEVWIHPAEPAECDPPCQDSFCVADDQCEPYPAFTSAGDITTTGVAGDLRFVAVEYGYQADPKFPPEDLFADDAAITVTAPGDEAAGFTLEAGGVVPLEHQLDLDFDVTLVIEDGVDEVIQWTAESSGEIQLALLTGHHGAPWYSLLICETEDDGELVVPGSLITQFPRDDSGFEQHGSWIARFRRDIIDDAAGPIELFVASRAIIPQVDHQP